MGALKSAFYANWGANMLRRASAPRCGAPRRFYSAYTRDYNAAKSEQFWSDAAKRITWTKAPTVTLDKSKAPFYRWYKDGTLNTCYNALDRHVAAGNGDRAAFIYASPITGAEPVQLTYTETLDRVSRFASVLKDLGVGRGDRVVIYMPMVLEAALAMLACARLGAVHSVVFGGFAAEELAVRIKHARPKVLITASCGVEPGQRVVPYADLVETALEQCPAELRPAHTVMLQRHIGPQVQRSPNTHDFASLLAGERRSASPVSVNAGDPLYVLYTSGTTGAPKGVVRDNGGHAVALSLSMERIFGINPGDVWWAASDLGWVVGHSYIVYGPLITGATSILFEGKPVGTPDAGTFWRIAAKHKVKALFCAPTALRAIKQADPEGRFLTPSLPTLRTTFQRLFVAGERADPPSLQWAEKLLGIRPLDNYWQTETGWPICSSYYGLNDTPSYVSRLGTAGRAMPGYDLQILDAELVNPVPEGQMGSLVATLPLPPGTMLSLWQDDASFVKKYLDPSHKYYITGDAAVRHPDGSIEVLARTDDVINVAGHRLSTGRLEEVATGHSRVAESCAVGAVDAIKGHVPLIFVTLKQATGAPSSAAAAQSEITKIEKEITESVRSNVGAIATPRHVMVVQRLPKTRSGKILRGVLRSMVGGESYRINSAEDPTVIAELRQLLKDRHGIDTRPPQTLAVEY